MPSYCNKCGHRLSTTNAKFCNHCGAPVARTQVTVKEVLKQSEDNKLYIQKDFGNQFSNVEKDSSKFPKYKLVSRKMVFGFLAILTFVILTFGIKSIFFNMKSTLKDGTLSKDGVLVDMKSVDLQNGEANLRKINSSENDKISGLVSDLYILEIDKEITKPITISIPIKQADSGTIMLGVGMDYQNNSDKTFTVYRYVEAEISNGIATASYIPSDYDGGTVKLTDNKTAKPMKVRYAKLGLFTRTSHYKDKGAHFSVTHPRAMGKDGTEFLKEADLDLLFSDMEEVYNMFIGDLGYSYSKRNVYPIQVHISNLGSLDGAYDSLSNIDNCNIYINSELLKSGYSNNQTKIKSIFTHEFFHFVQSNYTTTSTDSDWLDEATSTYFEWKENKGSTTLDALTNTWFHMYEGIFPEEDDPEQGYARMPLIQFLTEKNDEEFIRKVYESKPTSREEWIEAIKIATKMDPYMYAGDFYESYLTQKVESNYNAGLIYSSIVYGSGLVENVDKMGQKLNIAIPDLDDIQTEIEAEEYVPLNNTQVSIDSYGAKVIALNISMPADTSSMADDASLYISVDGNADLRILELTDKGNTENMLQGNIIEGINKKYGWGYTHLLLVTGLHDSSKENYNIQVEFFGGEQKTKKPIKNVLADFLAKTEPASSPLDYLRNAFVKAGSINLTYNDDANFTMQLPQSSGSLTNGYDTESYTFSGGVLTGNINQSTLDKYGRIGTIQGKYTAKSDTKDNRGNTTTINYTVDLTGTISPSIDGYLEMDLNVKYNYDYADPDIPDGKGSRNTSLSFKYGK
ncbi:MAG: zinc ribbon domain-containing protein [Lachnospiraceae bacterium]|nr:zinc ribbon domain-containing protein [Lachnospiraceae bacterium]